MTPNDDEIAHLREVIRIYKQRYNKTLALLEVAKLLLTNNKNIVVLKKDDDFQSTLDSFLKQVEEFGI